MKNKSKYRKLSRQELTDIIHSMREDINLQNKMVYDEIENGKRTQWDTINHLRKRVAKLERELKTEQ